MKTTALLISAILIAIVMLSGCGTGNIRESSLEDKIEHAISVGDYIYVYAKVRNLQRQGSRSISDYNHYMSLYRPQIEQGGLDFLSNRSKGIAVQYATYNEFHEAMKDSLNDYNAIASVTAQQEALEILKDKFWKSRESYPSEFPVDKVVDGMTKEEFYEVVPKTPINSIPVRIPSTPPTDFVVNEYEFTLPQEYKITGMQPIWVAFLNNKVVRAGFGNVKDAEYVGYQWFVNEDVAAGRINKSHGLRILYDKYKEVYGQPIPILHEAVMHNIMVTEKVDNGEITQTEADYLLAQKSTEVRARLDEMQRQQEAAARQQKQYQIQKKQLEAQQQQLAAQKQAQEQAAQMARSQLLMQTGMGLLQLNQMNQMNQSLRGIQSNTAPRTYSIRPSGSGYIATPR